MVVINDAFAVPYRAKLDVIMGGCPFFLGMGDTPEYRRDTAAMRKAIRREDIPVRLAGAVETLAEEVVDRAGGRLEVVDELGEPMTDTSAGFLVVREPWPSMLRGIWGDRERFKETYWSRFPGMYFAGDGARYDEDGDIWLLGRVDDVMNVSGHRLSTTEIESSLVAHPSVAESAVVGAKDETTGEAVVAFVLLTEDAAAADRGQLVPVAEQRHPDPALVGHREQGAGGVLIEHPGLVHHQEVDRLGRGVREGPRGAAQDPARCQEGMDLR